MNNKQCQMCGATSSLTRHHLIPKVKTKNNNKYKEVKNDTIIICTMCHSTIHATYSESELKDSLNTLEKIIQDTRIHKYLLWRMKHLDFQSDSTKMANRKR